MIRNLATPLLCALVVFAIGAGYEPGTSADAAAAARAGSMTLDTRMTVLPTVVVHPDAEQQAAAAAQDADSVVLDTAVEAAGTAIAAQVGAGVRRVSLAVPYYAFGAVTPRRSE